jgi:hypothetical protein
VYFTQIEPPKFLSTLLRANKFDFLVEIDKHSY